MTTDIVISSGHVRRGVVLTSGETMEVLAGGEAVRTTVSSGGVQEVYGRAISTTVAPGAGLSASQIVESGGVANYVTFVSGAEQVIEGGGTAAHITLIGADQEVYGRALDVSINQGVNEHVYSGGKLYELSATSGVTAIYSGALVSGAMISARATLAVTAGGFARDVVVSSGGILQDDQGARLSGDIVESGGAIDFVNGSATSGVIIESGSLLDYTANYDATLVGITVSSGAFIDCIGVIDRTRVLEGATASVSIYGSAIDTYIAFGAQEIVHGFDISGRVAGFQDIGSDGRASGTDILSGGYEVVGTRGIASHITISSGGVAVVSTIFAEGVILSGGDLRVDARTRVSGLSVEAGAVIDVMNEHYTSLVVSSGGVYFPGGPELYTLSGDTSGLSCTVKPDTGSGTDITFVTSGGDAILHAAAGFAATPASDMHDYSLQSAHAELFAEPSRIERRLA